MKESDYYPPGAYNDPNAPYNEEIKKPVDVDVAVTLILKKYTRIKTCDYEIIKEETSEDGESFGFTEYNFENSVLIYDYEQFEWTPFELMEVLRRYLEKDIEECKDKRILAELKSQLNSLNGWYVEEFDVIKS